MGQKSGSNAGQMDFLADTTLLIDLWREQRRPGAATAFAQRHPDARIGIPWVVAGEFLSGGVTALHDPVTLHRFLDGFALVQSDVAIIAEYATLYATLKRRGGLIGPNDLWISACALRHQCPLVTRNTSDFSVCPNLQVIDYTAFR